MDDTTGALAARLAFHYAIHLNWFKGEGNQKTQLDPPCPDITDRLSRKEVVTIGRDEQATIIVPDYFTEVEPHQGTLLMQKVGETYLLAYKNIGSKVPNVYVGGVQLQTPTHPPPPIFLLLNPFQPSTPPQILLRFPGSPYLRMQIDCTPLG